EKATRAISLSSRGVPSLRGCLRNLAHRLEYSAFAIESEVCPLRRAVDSMTCLPSDTKTALPSCPSRCIYMSTTQLARVYRRRRLGLHALAENRSREFIFAFN